MGAIVQRGCQIGLCGIAQLLAEVVRHLATRQIICRGAGAARDETVRISAKAGIVDPLELDREVSRAAIVLREEAIGLAAGGAADLHNFDTYPAQAVDDGLARRAGGTSGDDVDGGQTQLR